MALFIFLFLSLSVGKGGLIDKDYVARNGKVYILEALKRPRGPNPKRFLILLSTMRLLQHNMHP
jgi:hypothetical protein